MSYWGVVTPLLPPGVKSCTTPRLWHDQALSACVSGQYRIQLPCTPR
jgi:hypothetical protein